MNSRRRLSPFGVIVSVLGFLGVLCVAFFTGAANEAGHFVTRYLAPMFTASSERPEVVAPDVNAHTVPPREQAAAKPELPDPKPACGKLPDGQTKCCAPRSSLAVIHDDGLDPYENAGARWHAECL